MKKLILTSVCALAVAGVAFAQGTIQWVSGGSSLIVQTNSTLYSPLFGGGTTGSGASGNMGTFANVGAQAYYFMLLTQSQPGGSGSGNLSTIPSNLVALASWTPAWATTNAYGTNGAIAGRPAMGPAGDTGQTVTWANGTTNSILLVGWSANLGTTWSAVSNALASGSYSTLTQNAFFGVSSTGFINPGTVDPGNTIFGAANANGTLINNPSGTPMVLFLLPVPEPGTMALAGLGGLSLLFLRRRK